MNIFSFLPYIEYPYMANWGSENDRNVNYRKKCYLKFVRNFVPTRCLRVVHKIWIRILFPIIQNRRLCMSFHENLVNAYLILHNSSLGMRQTAKNDATPIKTLATTPIMVVWIDWIRFKFNGRIMIIYRLIEFFYC